MRSILSLGIVASALLLPTSAMAQVAGNWRVTGEVSGKAFTVDCRFEEKSGQLGGVCVDISSGDKSKPGKNHILSAGSSRGQDVNWTYSTKVMFMSVDIQFAGKLSNGTIAGTVTAKGRQGRFSATPL